MKLLAQVRAEFSIHRGAGSCINTSPGTCSEVGAVLGTSPPGDPGHSCSDGKTPWLVLGPSHFPPCSQWKEYHVSLAEQWDSFLPMHAQGSAHLEPSPSSSPPSSFGCTETLNQLCGVTPSPEPSGPESPPPWVVHNQAPWPPRRSMGIACSGSAFQPGPHWPGTRIVLLFAPLLLLGRTHPSSASISLLPPPQ